MPGVSPGAPLDADALLAPLLGFERVALAVSGGPDSLALLLLAHAFVQAHGGQDRFLVYSVDHGLRPEAAAEVAFVLREARRLGFEARGLAWEGAKPATGIQQAARAARYRLFAAAMRADGAAALVTAHHRDDQAETVLMRLAHGSGIEGLRGMELFSEVDGITVVRPLLGVDPAALRAVVAAAGLTPVTDPSNSDLDYERVRWRRMLPPLAALGLDAGRIGLFAARMRDADQALEHMAAAALAGIAVPPGARRVSFERDLLVGLPRAVAVRVVGRLLAHVGGRRKPHALAAVEALADRLRREPELRRSSLHGCLVRCEGGTISIENEPGRAAAAARRRRREPLQP